MSEKIYLLNLANYKKKYILNYKIGSIHSFTTIDHFIDIFIKLIQPEAIFLLL